MLKTNRTPENKTWGYFVENKYSIDALDVILRTGFEYEQKGDYLWILCPYHLDKTPSLTVCIEPKNKHYGMFKCWSCNTVGNILDFIIDNLGKSLEEGVSFLSSSITEVDEWKKLILDKARKHKIYKDIIELPYSFRKISEDNGRFIKYLKRRGIENNLNEFNIGYCESGYYRERIILPIYHNKKLVSFGARSVFSNSYLKETGIKKILYPANTKVNKVLFPDITECELYDKAFLVEGIFDVLTLHQLGYKNVFTTFSNKISKTQAFLLSRFKIIHVIPDADEGGEILIENSKNMLLNSKILISRLKEGDVNSNMKSIKDLIKKTKIIKDSKNTKYTLKREN